MNSIHEKKEDYDEVLEEFKVEPLTLLIEGYSQNVSDKWDEEGALYGATYVVTDLSLIDKGLSKLKGLSKVDDIVEEAANVNIYKMTAESSEVSYESLMHSLRQSESVEAAAVATLIKRNKIQYSIKGSYYDGRAGNYFLNSRRIEIYKNVKLSTGEWVIQSSESAAGTLAHETKHWIDNLKVGNVTRVDEFNAYQWQKAVDNNFKKIMSNKKIWELINTHPAYRHLKK